MDTYDTCSPEGRGKFTRNILLHPPGNNHFLYNFKKDFKMIFRNKHIHSTERPLAFNYETISKKISSQIGDNYTNDISLTKHKQKIQFIN